MDSVYKEFTRNEMNVEGEGNFRHDLTELDVCPAVARQMACERDENVNMMWNSTG